MLTLAGATWVNILGLKKVKHGFDKQKVLE
jgi:hypothetical protein